MWGTYILLLTVAINVSWCANVSGGSFAFQEDNVQDKSQQNAQGKKPVAGTCEQNEYLYPGDQKDDWVCDCKPGHIFDPVKDKCFPAYRRGFCKSGEHLVLPPNEVIPKCARNPCNEGWVQFRGKCYQLNSLGPCQPVALNPYIGVNEVTLAVECINQNHLPAPPIPVDPNAQRVGEEDEEKPQEAFKFPIDACFIGGRRSNQMICKDAAEAS